MNTVIPILILVMQSLSPDCPQYDRLSKYLKIIFNSSIHLQNVIDNALDISRIENNQFQLFLEVYEIRKSIEKVFEIMDFQIEQKGLRLLLEVDDSVPLMIKSDRKRIKQVLFNLIGNAVKYTLRGEITVTVELILG